MSSHDVLIKNAVIVDGTGAAPYKSELAVDGERVSSIGTDLGRADKVSMLGVRLSAQASSMCTTMVTSVFSTILELMVM